jgi:hypothetical protein
MEGTVAVPAVGIQGEMSMLVGKDGKFYMRVELPGVATHEAGSDGSTIWESSNVTGAEILTGVRAEQLKFQMSVFPKLRLEEFFDSAESAGKEMWGGEECNVVISKKKGLPPVTTYYSIQTGLEKGSRLKAASAIGDIDIKTEVKGYLIQDGIQYANLVETTFPNGMVQSVSIKTIKFNSKIDPQKFALPKEVVDQQ